jgi:menaquinone-dependent protoporphyrinogen oxidase
MKRIVQKAGGDTDTSRDYEYTDWNDRRAFAEQFVQLVQPRVTTYMDRFSDTWVA